MPFAHFQFARGARAWFASASVVPAEQAAFQRNLRRLTQLLRQALGLVEFALAALERMKGHGNDYVPLFGQERRTGGAEEQARQKRLEP